MTRVSALFPIGLFFLSGLALSACSDKEEAATRPVEGEIQLNGAFKAEFDLVDHFGEPASDERFEGKPVFVYFGFASCPDVCPAALGRMSLILDALGEEVRDIHTLFITVDPERDRPEMLRDYLSFDPRILGLTGTVEQSAAAAKAMNVAATKAPVKDSNLGYTVDHTSLFYLIDRTGKPVKAFVDTIDPEDAARAIRPMLR